MPSFGLRDVILSSGPLRIKTLKLIDFFLGTLIAWLIPGKKHQRKPSSVPSRILVIRPGGIGDAVLLLPVLKALRAQHPELTVDILCEKRNVEVFRTQRGPGDQIFLYHSWRDMTTLLKQHYDIVFDTEQWHYLTALLVSIIPSDATIGFDTRPLRAKLFDQAVPYDTNAYELTNFFGLFSTLLNKDHAVVNIDHYFNISNELHTWAKAKIPASSIIIALGASTPERRFSTEQVILLAEHVLSVGRTPVLLGGNDVVSHTAQIMQRMNRPYIIDLVGKTSLEESAALIERSALYIGPDSGLSHLACAVGTKVIVFFGPGDAKQWAPRGEKHIVITRHLPCSPCTRFGYSLSTCRGRYDCVRAIDMNIVLKEILPCHD